MKSMLNYRVKVDSTSKDEESEDIREIVNIEMQKTATPTEIISSKNENSYDFLNYEIPADLVLNAENECIGGPALWNNITDGMGEYFIKDPPHQNLHLIEETKRLIVNKKL